LCLELGAKRVIDYSTESFTEVVADVTKGKGADVIVDFIAADYFAKNIDSLAMDGRLVLLATLSGSKIQNFDLRKILSRRLSVIGSTLRNRSLDYQIALTKDFVDFALPRFKEERLKPVIDRVLDWNQVKEAHAIMESNKNSGKIVLKVVHEE
jgi:NADPH:quinone reductase-like Zn-dependent oxidoreductase